MRVNLEEVPLADCVHSRFNTRKTRDEKQIQRLAERIERNGFEPTRALWGVRVGDKVEVFAGGTRLEACRRIGLLTVPVMIHVGIGDEEVSRRADVDNENDEYHAPVGLLDVWAEYYRLAAPQAEGGEAWKLDRIARAKGDVFESGEPDLMKASLRVRFHRDLPRLVRDAVRNGLLDEGHCKGVIEVVSNIPNWLSSDQAQTELVAEVLGKHVGKSQGVKPTVKVVREAAQRWKQLIALAADQRHGVDFVLPSGFGARVRTHDWYLTHPDEFTMRSRLDSGSPTELEKILMGDGQFWFYGFEAPTGDELCAWTIIGLRQFRRWCFDSLKAGALPGREIPNKADKDSVASRSWFRVFSLREAAAWDAARRLTPVSPDGDGNHEQTGVIYATTIQLAQPLPVTPPGQQRSLFSQYHNGSGPYG